MQSVTLVSCYFFYQNLKVFITYNFLELNFKFIIFHIFLMQRIVTFLAIYPPCNYTISSQSFLCKFQFHPLLTVVLNQKKAKTNFFTSSTTAGPFDRSLNVALPVPSVSEFLEDAFLLWRGAIASINKLHLKNHFWNLQTAPQTKLSSR